MREKGRASKNSISMGSLAQMLKRAWPYLAALLLQFGYAGMAILCKFALDQGLSEHVLVVYRHAIATLVIAPFAIVCDRNLRPKMTFSVFAKIMLLALSEPVIDQNLYYTGMRYTSATYTAALANVLPAFAFLMACSLNLEKVNVRRLHSQAMILGTAVTVGGAMMMTLLKGSILNFPWTKGGTNQDSECASDNHKLIYGALLITTGCICWSAFINLQAITLKSYPAELSLTAWICFMGAAEGTVMALVLERHNPAAWSIHLDSKFLAVVYSGVLCSGVAYYVQGLIMKEKGPVFVSSFNPLSMVIVAIMGSIFLAETIYLGRVIGAIVIVIGLYLVLWGKSKDTDEVKSTPPNGSNCSETTNNHTRVESMPI